MENSDFPGIRVASALQLEDSGPQPKRLKTQGEDVVMTQAQHQLGAFSGFSSLLF